MAKIEGQNNCYHFGSLDYADSVQKLIKKGLLTCNTGFLCDWRVPVDQRLCHGQNIDCLGPNHPDCPDPSAA